MDTIWLDVRYAARSLARRPLVSAVAVISLALGIGVNTAVFSVFERLMLRRLPVPDAQSIVNVTSPGPRPGSTSISGAGGRDATFSHPLFRDLERVQNTFSGIAAHRDIAANLTWRGDTVRVMGIAVSGGYFSTLSLRPALGRLLIADDDRPGSGGVVVLSHDYWTRRFAGSTAVVNAAVAINGRPATIVGVAPEGFKGTVGGEVSVDVFVPLVEADLLRSTDTYANRRDHWLYVFGRLQPGVSRTQAEARLAPLFAPLIRDVEFPLQKSELDAGERNAFLARTIALEDGSRGSASFRSETAVIASLLFVVTGLVLLIACANIANLLMARAVDRSTEMAVRLSLGASAGRLLRLLLTEACLLGLVASGLAYVLGYWTVAGTMALIPSDGRQPLEFEINIPVLRFAGALGLASGLLFGLFPALYAARTSTVTDRTARAIGSRGATRFRTSLAVAQIALATALLAQAGLSIASLKKVAKEDLGIRPEGLITFGINPAFNGYSRPQASALFEQIEDRLSDVPGVVSVSASTIPLLGNGFARNTVTVQGFEAGASADVTAAYAFIGPAYFATVGIPLRRGREFTRGDAGESPTVAIVNEAFARKFGLGNDAVGKRMALGRRQPLELEIVGLVADAKYSSIRDRAVPQFFLPYRQTDTGSLNFYIRSQAGTGAISSAVLSAVKEADRALPVEDLRTMTDQIDRKIGPDRVLSTLSSAFAVLATLLAGIGLYAVLAYAVARRTREFGVRMALGARAIEIGRLVVLQVGRLTVLGGLIGAGLALGLSQLSRAILFGIDGTQGVVTTGAVAVVVAMAALAAFLPIRRAARVDPAVTLRAE